MDSQGNDLKALFGLEGKHVLITGACSLMSVWIARMMLMVGTKITLTDRISNKEIVAAYRDFAKTKNDPGLDVAEKALLIGDVDIRNHKKSDTEAMGKDVLLSVEEMVKKAVEGNGHIDVLINIAGGQEPIPASALTPDIFQKTVSRILLGTWNVIFEVFHKSMKAHGGRILTVTADAEQGFSRMPGMGAARNGLLSLHKACAVEWAPYGVTTCVIAPGPADTPGLKRYPGADIVREVAIRACLQKRLIDAKEIAWIFVVMASPLARSVSGHNLVANCGDSLVHPVFKEFEKLGLT